MTMIFHTQSLQAPTWVEAPSPRSCDVRLKAIRGQAALVRALTDELDRIVPSSWAEQPISEQLIEEMTSLGHKILEIASALAETKEGQCSIATPGCGERNAPVSGS
jgi:hypothetical protein